MNYLKRGISSFNLLKNNLRLYLPDVFFISILLVSSMIFLKLTGLSNLAQAQPTIEQLSSIIKPNLMKIAILTIIFLLLLFFISIQITATKLSIIKNIIQNKKFTLKDSFNEGLKYYIKVLSLKLLIFLIFLIPLIIIIILNTIIKITLLKTIFLILLALSWFILLILFIYRYPILFLSEKKPISALKESYKRVLNNKIFTFIIILILILIYIISFIIISILNLFILKEQSSFTTLINTIIIFIQILINITASLMALIYIFLSFKELPS